MGFTDPKDCEIKRLLMRAEKAEEGRDAALLQVEAIQAAWAKFIESGCVVSKTSLDEMTAVILGKSEKRDGDNRWTLEELNELHKRARELEVGLGLPPHKCSMPGCQSQ